MRLIRKGPRSPGEWLAWADDRVIFRRGSGRKVLLYRNRKLLGTFRTRREAIEVARKHWRPRFAELPRLALQRAGVKQHPEIAGLIDTLVETEDPVALLQLADWLTDQEGEKSAEYLLWFGKLAGIRLK